MLLFVVLNIIYRNDSKFLDSQVWANSADPDQTEGAVRSGSTLFAIPSASFGRITLWLTVKPLQIFRVSEFVGFLQHKVKDAPLYHYFPKFLDGQAWANSAHPDQTAPRGAVWSGSTLFAIPSASFEKLSCSTFRVITTNVLGVRIFREFTVPLVSCCGIILAEIQPVCEKIELDTTHSPVLKSVIL